MVADVPLGETLHRIATLATEAVPPTVAVGLSLLDERGHVSTSVYTDPLSPEVDEAQYRDQQGPCLEAFRKGATVRVDDTRQTRDDWPAFSEKAAARGVLSVLSIPLLTPHGSVGALNLFATEAGAYTEESEAAAADFGTQASVAITNALAYWRVFDLTEGLRAAIQSRETIGLAKGLIMAANKCSSDEAFHILVRASQRENVKLRDLAARIVETRNSNLSD
jgi:GAF domain-containing protein